MSPRAGVGTGAGASKLSSWQRSSGSPAATGIPRTARMYPGGPQRS